MKKLPIILGITAIFGIFLLGNFTQAEYELQIDTGNNEVYLTSGDTQISLENAAEYLSGVEINSNTGASSTDTTNSGSTANSGTVAGTGSEANTGNTVGTGAEVSSGTVAGTGTETATGTTATTGTETSTGNERTLGENINAELLTGDEFDKALYWMYANGLTRYDNSDEFRPHDNLTREEAAKMIGQLYSVLGFPKENKGFNCSFVDTNMFHPTLAEHIYNVCRRGIFKGNDVTQQYMPRDSLTKGQLLAVLLRIFEGKVSNESGQPRWIEYYVKASTISMTNEINLAKFDQPVSRREASLLIFRFKNMVLDKSSYQLLLARLASLEGDNESYIKQIEELKSQRESNSTKDTNKSITDNGNPDSNGIIGNAGNENLSGNSITGTSVSLDIIAGNETLTDDPEFIEAINRMYDMGITSYNTTEGFMPYQTITRAQIAKMLDKFASATNLTTIRNFGNCKFSDIDSQSEFYDSITRVCQYGIMAGSNDKFSPEQIVIKAEFIAMLIRLFDGKTLDESLNPRRISYYKRAIEIGLIGAQDTVTFSSNIARYEVAAYLYRLKVRLTMYNNLNSSQLSEEIVKTLSETVTTGDDGKINVKVYVDILALNNSAFTDGYIELLGERYKVKKSGLDNYNVGTNSFVRYGTLYNMETDDAIGSISFTLTNGTLTEGTIRANKVSYYLEKDPNTTTYYNLTQK